MRKNWFSAVSLSLLAALGGCTPGGPNPNAVTSGNTSATQPEAADPSKSGQTLMALYMIGSDLEDGRGEPDRGGAGTADFNEIVAAYKALSSEQQANVNYLVAFGGANQEGWRGIKYADTACLVQDSEDGRYGNDSCYAHTDESANMGDGATLQAFMTHVNAEAGTPAKKIFTFWDHGASYMGVGPDSNHLQDGILTMKDLNTAFASTQSRYDAIGFDACLMASIEVAQAVHEFGDYMIASEELEPGHGWDYEELTQFMGTNPGASVVTLGRKFVDSFIDSPKHQNPYSNNKTLSLVDLQQFDKVIAPLDELSGALEANLESSYAPVLQAASRAEAYGVQNQNSVEMGVDLKHFAENLKAEQPDLAAPLDSLVGALDSYVVYAKREQSKPNANGVSIFSPRYPNPVENDLYSEDAAASKAWRSYTQDFVEKGKADTEAPVIVSEESDCADGVHCLTITDNVGISEALSINAFQDPEDENQVYITSTINMDLTASKEDNLYGLIAWDGSAAAICNGPCDETLSNGLGVPFNLENFTEDKRLLATADGSLNGEKVVFHMIADENGIAEFWAIPYTIDAEGNVIMSREQLPVGAGDRITFTYEKIDLTTEEAVYEESDPLTFSAAPVFDDVALPGVRFYFAVASDLKGNTAVSEPRLVE
ncbi:MAG: clostripain-related cysteine peptidase [Candidatus Sericytochromatia bacterium]